MDRFILFILCLNIFSAEIGNAQDRITSLSLDEAVALATRENFTLRAAQFEYQATRANEVTAGLIPNPSFSYLGEQLNEPANASAGSHGAGQQYTVTIGQTFETGGKRQRETVDFAYRRGGASLLDFLDAQRTYRETSLEYVRSLGNYWTPLHQLELAVGGSLVK
jgi:outer membrane protein TolC